MDAASLRAVCGGLRRLGFDMDGRAGATNASIAKAMLRQGVPAQELLDMAEGLALLVREWSGPSMRPSMALLYSRKLNGPDRTPMQRRALTRLYDSQKRGRAQWLDHAG